MSAPILTNDDLKGEIARLGRHPGTFVAIYGTGEAGDVHLEGKGMVKIIPVKSELDLRAQLPPLSEDPYCAFLVPFFGVLPADIAGRFIGQGSIARIGPAAKLAARTGASSASDAAAKLQLASYLLRPENSEARYPAKTQELSADGLMAAWLHSDWGVPVEGGIAADALLGWAAVNVHGGKFDAEMKVPAAMGVSDELIDYLKQNYGEVAPVILDAWRQGKGPQLLGFALLAEVLAPYFDAELKYWYAPKLSALGISTSELDLGAIAKALSQLARPALSWVRSNERSQIPRIFAQAEKLIDDQQLDEFLIHSTRLPRAWKLRLRALNDALLQLSKTPTREALKGAQVAWTQLEKHELFLSDETPTKATVRRAEMALRLAAWLVARPEEKLEAPSHAHVDVETLGAWYAEEGGYLDWARRVARAEGTVELSSGIQAVVEAADLAREQLDARFSAALTKWIEAGRPSQNVLPIDQALKRIGARFLEQEEDRNLLVLLMDGMAWAQAVELLPSLGEGGRRWGPIAWHQMGKNRVGRGNYPVMLAALPTVTEVSRAAFFAGAMPKNGATLDTKKDKDHFATNKALQSFSQQHLQPRLMLRDEGHTSDGTLTEAALNMIAATSERRVVGLVVNAIDASLKADSQQETSWGVESIRSLPQIFDAAQEHGRHILIAADHGHVPAARLKSIGQSRGGGARYRKWEGSDDELVPGERKFSGSGVYLPKGSDGVVLLENDCTRYGGAPHAGEHGGSAMAEVIAPCVLLGWEDEVRTQQDPALAVRGLYVPDWWTLSLPDEQELVRDEPAARPKKKGKKPDPNQAGMPWDAPNEKAEAPSALAPDSTRNVPATKAADLLPAFYNSEMLKARASKVELRKQVVSAVHFLLTRSGAVPAAAFAAHAGLPGFRVPGLVSSLQEVLNLDGYEVLRFDRTNQQIFLEVETLKQQFDVEL